MTVQAEDAQESVTSVASPDGIGAERERAQKVAALRRRPECSAVRKAAIKRGLGSGRRPYPIGHRVRRRSALLDEQQRRVIGYSLEGCNGFEVLDGKNVRNRAAVVAGEAPKPLADSLANTVAVIKNASRPPGASHFMAAWNVITVEISDSIPPT